MLRINACDSLSEAATASVQDALKEIEIKTKTARSDAAATMTEISNDVAETEKAIKEPLNQLRTGISDVRFELLAVKAAVEKAPARLDVASDTAGSMQTQSTADMERFGVSLKKILFNLKIAGYVAKENKDLMLGNICVHWGRKA